MNYTFDTKTGDGTTTAFTFGFAGPDEGYIDLRRDLRVFVNGAEVPFTTNFADPNKVFITPAPAAGASILIRRIMPRTSPYSDFKGSNAFTPQQLNNTALQQLYLTQEILDGFYDPDFYLKQDLNMGGHGIVNIRPGSKPGDAVNWDQLTAVDKKHTDWNSAQDAEISALKIGMVDNVSSRTVPWLHVAVGGETSISPPFNFKSAWVWRDGVMQYQLDGAFSISGNRIIFPAMDALRVGEKVLIAMGSTAAAPDDHPSFGDVFSMIDSVLSQAGAMAKVAQLSYVSDLRTTTPAAATTVVQVKQYAAGSIRGGGKFFYDPNDTTSQDDGVFTFVTSGGHRWKRSWQGKMNPTWFGVYSQDITTPLQRAINYVVSVAVSTKSFTGIPVIEVDAGKYLLSNQIHSAPFVDIRSSGGEVTFRQTNDITMFVVNNNWDGLANNDYPSMGPSSAATFLNGINGRINLIGLGKGVSTKLGVQLGNDTVDGVLPVREPLMYNVTVTGFNAPLKMTTKHTYLCSFKRCRFEKNTINLLLDDTTARNSGERMSFDDCIFGDCDDSQMLHNCSGVNINFINCSFDFSKGRMIRFGASGAYSAIRFTDCWIEHWDGDMVRQAQQIAGAGANDVQFLNCTILPRNGANWNAMRPFATAQSPIYIDIDKCMFILENTNNKLSGTLIDYDDAVSNNNVVLTYSNLRTRLNYLPRYADAFNSVVLSGTDGTDITTTGDSSIGIDVVATAGATVKYVTVDGRKALELSCTSNTDTVSLYYRYPVPVSNDKRVYAMCSVRAGGATGAINVSGLARSFGKDTVVNGSIQENLLGTSADTTFNILPTYTAPGIPNPGTYQFFATPPLPSKPFARSFYTKPGLRFTGFTGVIQVILPAWWADS